MPNIRVKLTKLEFRTITHFAAFCERHGLKAGDAASLVGLSRAQTYKLVSGEQAVTPTLARLLELLDVHGIPREWQHTTEDNEK